MDRDETLRVLNAYNQGRIEGEWCDILDAVDALENELAASQAEEHKKRSEAIQTFIERNSGEITYQRERAEEVAKRVQSAVLLQQELKVAADAHATLAASNELSVVMHDLNQTARIHGMIVRLLSGDDEAVREIYKIPRGEEDQTLNEEEDQTFDEEEVVVQRNGEDQTFDEEEVVVQRNGEDQTFDEDDE